VVLLTVTMNLQLSGDVSDESAQAIGRMLGAQSIVSGTLTNMGNFHRFRIRVINVETAAIQTQISLDLQNNSQVSFLLGSSPASTSPAVPGTTIPGVTVPPVVGTMVPGHSLSDKLTWLQRSADSHNTYVIEVNADESIPPHTFQFTGGINITIALRGVGTNRTIRLRSHGSMFTVNSNVTFILENNIILQGHNGNNGSMIVVNGGTFRMNTGSTITSNNTSAYGGAVRVDNGTFEMTGGTISGNTASSHGGGVFTRRSFTMAGGIIIGNTAPNGGGVYSEGTFTIRSGTITGNIARINGGGVHIGSGTFTKSGGSITGYSSDQSSGNVVKDDDGYIIARNGHAVFISSTIRKETSAGPEARMSYGGNRGTTGAWDN